MMIDLTAHERSNFWHDHIAAFIASGTTQKSYCKIHELNYSKFKQWRYRLSDKFPVNADHPRVRNKLLVKNNCVAPIEPTVSNNLFAAVKVIDEDHKLTELLVVTLHLKNDISLEFPCNISLSDLNKIFAALEIL